MTFINNEQSRLLHADCDDCGELATTTGKYWTWHDRYREIPLCAECAERQRRREEDGPGDPDGEAFRGGEAAAYENEQMARWQRLK